MNVNKPKTTTWDSKGILVWFRRQKNWLIIHNQKLEAAAGGWRPFLTQKLAEAKSLSGLSLEESDCVVTGCQTVRGPALQITGRRRRRRRKHSLLFDQTASPPSATLGATWTRCTCSHQDYLQQEASTPDGGKVQLKPNEGPPAGVQIIGETGSPRFSVLLH